MAEQAIDLRSTLSILRRHRRLLSGSAVLGIAAGTAYVLLRPPMYTSTTQVLLPAPAVSSSGQTISHDTATELQIARSGVVLTPAGQVVRPVMTAHALSKRVHVSAPSTGVIQIRASASTVALAEQLSEAVANAYVTYEKRAANGLDSQEQADLQSREAALQTQVKNLQSEIQTRSASLLADAKGSPAAVRDSQLISQLRLEQGDLSLQVEKLQQQETAGAAPVTGASGAGATVIQDASPGVRPGLVGRVIVFSILGLLLATVLVSVLIVMFARRDRRLRSRDDIADALGSAVIASIRSHVPRGVAGWTTLLQNYTPETVDAWALRQALRQLVFGDSAIGARHGGATVPHPVSMTVITLADDARGLALGPQIASFAASLGVGTGLVAAQRHESGAALWAACASASLAGEIREGLVVDAHETIDAELTVVLACLDRRRPELIDLPATSVTILAVSSGSATAEDLARLAVAVDDAGNRIHGILVADPDKLDHTTGRLSQQERVQRVPLPTRLTGVTPPEGRSQQTSAFRRRLR